LISKNLRSEPDVDSFLFSIFRTENFINRIFRKKNCKKLFSSTDEELSFRNFDLTKNRFELEAEESLTFQRRSQEITSSASRYSKEIQLKRLPFIKIP